MTGGPLHMYEEPCATKTSMHVSITAGSPSQCSFSLCVGSGPDPEKGVIVLQEVSLTYFAVHARHTHSTHGDVMRTACLNGLNIFLTGTRESVSRSNKVRERHRREGTFRWP